MQLHCKEEVMLPHFLDGDDLGKMGNFYTGGFALPDAKVTLGAYTPFFATVPFPVTLNASHVEYFFTALQQLSQLVHDVAANCIPGKDNICHVKRSLLIFHIDHFVQITFADANFMRSLTPVSGNDETIVEYLSLIRWFGDQLVVRWREALQVVSSFSFNSSSQSLHESWIAVKNTADAISFHTMLQKDLTQRVCIHISKRWKSGAFTVDGEVSLWFRLLWITYGFMTACMVVIAAWVSWSKPTLWGPVFTTVATALGFGSFLGLFNMLTMRQSRCLWLAKLLSENHLADAIERQTVHEHLQMGKVAEFAIRCKDNALVTLAIKSSVLNRHVVMIGIVNTESLAICSWNEAARVATDILPGQAVEKSLEAVMDTRSIATVRRLFRELKFNPRQKQRLLLNNVRRETPVAIEASVTIAHVDEIPIGMIVGTIVKEEEVGMSYFSRVSTFSTLRALSFDGCTCQVVRNLVVNNGWVSLMQRTTQATRSWCSSTLEDLLKSLRDASSSQVDIQPGSGIPMQFQCDAVGIQQLLAKLMKDVVLNGEDRMLLEVTCVNCGAGTCLALQFDASVPDTSRIDLETHQDVVELLSLMAYLTRNSRRHLQLIVPIVLKPFGMEVENDSILEHSGKRLLTYTVVLHEPDVVYKNHLIGFCNQSQHHTFAVESLDRLEATLGNYSHDVDVVILSDTSPEFDAWLSFCREKSIFLTITRERSENSSGCLGLSTDGPPRYADDGDYVLQKPVSEDRWLRFLKYLSELKEQERTVLSPAPMAWNVMQRIGEGSCSIVDLVQDKLTGGYMACKTVNIAHKRSLNALRDEVNIMRQCSSLYIIQCISTSYSPSTADFRMFLQYCPTSLERYARNKRVTTTELALYAFQIVSAVQHLYEKGIAHRDIKPANILMMNERHLKLADFGSATQKPFDEGNVHGVTLQFMAPERLLIPTEDTSWRTTPMDGLFKEDIWSIGLTLLDVAGVYPPVLKNLSDMKDFVNFYMHLRDSGKELSLELPLSASTESPEKWESFRSFVSSMLRLQQHRRPRAYDLLQHPFIKDAAAACECSVKDEFVWPGPSIWSDRALRPNHQVFDDVQKSFSSMFTATSLDDADEDAEDRFSDGAFNSVVK
ncbi:putative map kinase [Trypanosoma grayi]|uniref:putative map kinase n=1 Tax=Trypanosoma grayi TaxID=71804 RepID=UPI0004F430F3|nr:putative map kinase [Trypanosoma grayi]KEG14935.1 putative map kinase [Trypanosoma grayi]